jgi:hypothetical protein
VAKVILGMLPWMPESQVSAVSLCVLGGQVSLVRGDLGCP